LNSSLPAITRLSRRATAACRGRYSVRCVPVVDRAGPTTNEREPPHRGCDGGRAGADVPDHCCQTGAGKTSKAAPSAQNPVSGKSFGEPRARLIATKHWRFRKRGLLLHMKHLEPQRLPDSYAVACFLGESWGLTSAMLHVYLLASLGDCLRVNGGVFHDGRG
jgi:hypothetical protein